MSCSCACIRANTTRCVASGAGWPRVCIRVVHTNSVDTNTQVLFVWLALLAGYVSVYAWGTMERSYNGWPTVCMRVSVMVPGIIMAIFTLLNLVIAHTGGDGSKAIDHRQEGAGMMNSSAEGGSRYDKLKEKAADRITSREEAADIIAQGEGSRRDQVTGGCVRRGEVKSSGLPRGGMRCMQVEVGGLSLVGIMIRFELFANVGLQVWARPLS